MIRQLCLVILAIAITVPQATNVEAAESEIAPSSNKGHQSGTAQSGQRPSLSPRFDVALIGHRQVDHGLNLYSMKDEELLGNRLATLVEHDSELITDASVTQYIDRLEQTISRNSDIRTPLKVKVVRDVEVNAYSVPGFIYIESGLIIEAENEAQLVAALSHETAHVAGRHLTKFMSEQRFWKWSTILAGGPVGYLFGRKAAPYLLMKISRGFELEADLLGLQYEYASGYDPAEFVNLVKNVSRDDERPSVTERLQNSHPPAEVRIRNAQQYITRYLPPRAQSVVDTSEFQEVKARVRVLLGLTE